MNHALVLDVDDTLYLERDYVHSGFLSVGESVHAELGLSGFGERAWEEFQAGRRGDIFDRCLISFDVEPEPSVIRRLVEVYRDHEPTIGLLADAAVFIGDARATGCPLAVITDGPVQSQRAKVHALGLSQIAAPVVLTSELGPDAGKPSPVAFRLVQRELGIEAERLVYVADNPAKDFAAPAELGWRTVRVRRHLSLHVDVPSGPDVELEVEDLHGLLQLLARRRQVRA